MSVKLAEVRQITEQPEATLTSDNRDAEYSAILMGFTVAARILAVRFFLFLSLVGSFVLSLTAAQNQSVLSVWIVGVFATVTTLPLTVLEFRGKRG